MRAGCCDAATASDRTPTVSDVARTMIRVIQPPIPGSNAVHYRAGIMVRQRRSRTGRGKGVESHAMGAVFISYRRGDVDGQARALVGDPSNHVGRDNVFIDVDSIAPGRDFRQVLKERLETCDMVLALIGGQWLDAKDQAAGDAWRTRAISSGKKLRPHSSETSRSRRFSLRTPRCPRPIGSPTRSRTSRTATRSR